MYIHERTIPDLVAYKLNHPEHLFVSANVINSWRFQELHNAFMVTLPFAPDHTPLQNEILDWRVSKLHSAKPPSSDIGESHYEGHRLFIAPDYKHCWLPMQGGTLDDTPIRNGLHECSGADKWQCAAIAHYSLFSHLEKGIVFL